MTAPNATATERPLTHRILEELLPNLAVLATLVAPLRVWDRLPERVASHWSWSGVPDDSLTRVQDTVLVCIAAAAVAYGPIVAARFPMPRSMARILVAVAGFGSVLLAGVRIASVRANLDAPTWDTASRLDASTIGLALVAAVVASVIGAYAASSRPDVPPPVTGEPDRVTVAPGEAVVWVGAASGRTPVVVAAVLLLVAVLAVVFAPPELRTALVVAMPLAALAVAAFGQVRATVGPRGLTVTCGWLGWPRLRVPVEDVADVLVEDVKPMSYGGWGFRQVPGVTAIVVRRGEGLRIERHEGRTLVVTVDDAARAAGVLLAHRGAVSDGSAG